MIKIIKINNGAPYNRFESFYNKALKSNQNLIEAILIASYDKNKKEVDARYVNLKYILDDEWIFFSNYKSKKACQFELHEQISTVFHWESIGLQIRMKAKIYKTSKEFSNEHFRNRSKLKNALAISSNQSKKIESYEKVLEQYQNVLSNKKLLSERPNYWGGFSFIPYYFEFWEGNDSRINKREVFEYENKRWKSSFLEP